MLLEINNDQRAEWAREATDVFGQATFNGRTFTDTVIEENNDPEGDAYCMVQDLMCDLIHLAKRHGWDTERLSRNALENFKDEVRDEERLIEIAAEDAGEEAQLLG